jgi:hypothetical protein
MRLGCGGWAGQDCDVFVFGCIVMRIGAGSRELGLVGQDCNVFTSGCIVMQLGCGSGE